MKILFILPRYHTNYIEVFKSLLIKRYKIKLCIYNYGLIEDHKLLKPEYIKSSLFTNFLNLFYKSKLNKFYFPNIFHFNKMISQFNPEIVIIRPYSKLFTFLIMIFRIFKKYKLIFYHQTNSKNLKKFNLSFKFFKFFLINKIFKIRSYSPLFRKSDKFFFKRLFFLPFVTSIKFTKKRTNKKYRFLMIGKFLKKKNHEMFLNGIKFLNENFDVEGTIVGEVNTLEQKKEFKRIKRLTIDFQLEKKVNIIKNVKYKKIKNFFKKNDFFVLPTNHDPAPFSILEAMSYGCLVLCSSSCGTKSYIDKNINGFVFKNNDQASLNKFMLKMIKNREKFRNNSKKNSLYIDKLLGRKNFYSSFQKLIAY